MAAACAAVVALVFFSMLFACVAYSDDWSPKSERDSVRVVPIFVGLAVLVSWTTLRLGGRWRSEPSWIDRLGRTLGIYWTVAAVVVVAGFTTPHY